MTFVDTWGHPRLAGFGSRRREKQKSPFDEEGDEVGSDNPKFEHNAQAGDEYEDRESDLDEIDDLQTTDDDDDRDAGVTLHQVTYNGQMLSPSTKIRRLLDILKKETPEHKVIVFSQFTSMLNIVEPFLRQQGHKFVRYDGSMRNDAREESLNRLRSDKKTRILLCSLKCGSLGLNLTAASRVVIMEPFWNPVSWNS